MLKLRELFDVGVSISLGDDDILVTGTDWFIDSQGEYLEHKCVETMYEFPSDTTIENMIGAIKAMKLEEYNQVKEYTSDTVN